MRALVLCAVFLLVACGEGSPAREGGAAPQGTGEGGPTDEESAGAPIEPMPRLQVAVYFPAADGNGLVGELHEIFETATAVDRIKQIVADLISGPTDARSLRFMPPGTQLRQAYVVEDTAWLDFSSDIQKIGGGSTEELLVVYAIVDSVALNLPEIHEVGILVAGRPIETLNGHLDLSHPLPPDRSLILGNSAQPSPVARRRAPIRAPRLATQPTRDASAAPSRGSA